MTGHKRPQSDWYSAYFAPTTVLIAVSVLMLSIETGKLVGSYYVQKDRAAQMNAPVTTVTASPTTSIHTKPSARRSKTNR